MKTMQDTKFTNRLLARFIIEAKTPLAVGTGQKDVLTDAVVALDVNGLPYIPGTSIAGVLRSMIDPKQQSPLFGYQKKNYEVSNGEPKGLGSEIIVSEARILNSKQEVMDGIFRQETLSADPLLKHYLRPMPIRQHVRIDHKGTAEDKGKFDQQIVYAGTRFCFEIEIVSKDDNLSNLNDVIDNIRHQSFRLGGGVHNGFGRIEVNSVKTAVLDLSKGEELDAYLNKSSVLSDDSFWSDRVESERPSQPEKDYVHYQMLLSPDDFLMFGSGFGDENGDADMTTVKAAKVKWNPLGTLEKDKILIPATSVKGALRHRVTYHYNKLNGYTIGGTKGEPFDAEHCPATREIFGWNDGNSLVPGCIMLEDIIDDETEHKLVNHVSIDRFTGGAIDGALFTEQIDYAKGRKFCLDIFVTKTALSTGDYTQLAFETALKDICKGLLPLGGGVNRGNGIFHGKLIKDESVIYE